MTIRRRNRTVSDEELSLWRYAMRDAEPICAPRPDASPPQAVPPPPPAPVAVEPRPSVILRPFQPEKPSVHYKPGGPLVSALGPSTPGLDRRLSERMRKGDRTPDSRIDLHGMTLERAHDALYAFILACVSRGDRLALVITGKGGDYKLRARGVEHWGHGRAGALRNEAPRWFAEARFRMHIVGVYPAHVRHGGDGAYYVYLRKPR